MHDLRLAFRLLRRNPISTFIALLSIALSIGAASVVFAAIKSVLLDPLPYAHADELVQFRSEFPGMPEQAHSDWVVFNDTRELARRSRTLESIGISGNAVFDLAGDPNTTPQALYGVLMNADLFGVLGVSPMLGRNVLPEEDRPVPGRDDFELRAVGQPFPFGPLRGGTHSDCQRARVPDNRRDASRVQLSDAPCGDAHARALCSVLAARRLSWRKTQVQQSLL